MADETQAGGIMMTSIYHGDQRSAGVYAGVYIGHIKVADSLN